MPGIRTAAAVLMILALMGHPADGPEGKAEIEVGLTADRNLYEPTSDIVLEVRIENTGAEPVAVFSNLLWGHMGGLVLRIHDQAGQPVHPRFLDHDMPVPDWIADPGRYVILYPRHFLGVSRVDRIRDLVMKPGRYEISVEYLSPVPQELAPTPSAWTRERGGSMSAPIVITVVGNEPPE